MYWMYWGKNTHLTSTQKVLCAEFSFGVICIYQKFFLHSDHSEINQHGAFWCSSRPNCKWLPWKDIYSQAIKELKNCLLFCSYSFWCQKCAKKQQRTLFPDHCTAHWMPNPISFWQAQKQTKVCSPVYLIMKVDWTQGNPTAVHCLSILGFQFCKVYKYTVQKFGGSKFFVVVVVFN